MPDLKAAVIGASGRMGQEHIAAYEACGVSITPLLDIADIISIASPDNTHAGEVISALANLQHVFCEKPIATNGSDLKEIESFHVERGMIGQNFPLRHRFANLDISSIGEIYRVDAAYNWGRTHKLSEGWRAEDPNYSLVLGGLIHMVDLVLWLTGLDIEVIDAIGVNKSAPGFNNHDTVTALCRLSNEGICNFTVDGGTGVSQHSHFLRIHGTKGHALRINTQKTDKRAAIKDFVRDIRDGTTPTRDFRATKICLDIEKRASISAGR